MIERHCWRIGGPIDDDGIGPCVECGHPTCHEPIEFQPFFKGQIFLGNGETSKERVEELHKRVDRVIELLGALQQPDDPMTPLSPQSKRERAKMILEFKKRVREIKIALTGVE